jgi:transcriptional regulator with XRE-family HTH domain
MITLLLGVMIMLTTGVVGERIKNAREEKKISQKLLCDMLQEVGIEISRETLSKIENGSRIVSAIEIKKIADVLGIDPQKFLEEEEEQDLVMLFRRSGKFDKSDEECLEELDEIQYFLKSFIRQKAIHEGRIKVRN